MTGKTKDGAPPFAIFRACDAVEYDETGVMTSQPLAEAAMAGSAAMLEAGMLEGSKLRLLFSRPGFSLSYAWFKSGFPLPRHSHNADCLYFIIAGSLRIGTEELGPGDGFFVGSDVPYTYMPGDLGVEVLEFRDSNNFDLKLLANNPEYWRKALDGLLRDREKWTEQIAPPSGLKIG
jgi:hypothetical protein